MNTSNWPKNRLIYYFQDIFISNNNALAKLISDITKIPYNKLKNNVLLITNETPINEEILKKKNYIVKINNESLKNIVLNNNNYKSLKNNNISYSFNLYSNSNDEFLIIGINLNTFSNKNNNYLDIYELRNKEGIKYIDNFKIYTLDIVKCFYIYNKDNKTKNDTIKWGAFFYSKIEDDNRINIIDSILTKKELENINSKLKSFSNY